MSPSSATSNFSPKPKAICRRTRPSASPAPMASRPSPRRSEEHTSELQSLMRISYAVFCLKKQKQTHHTITYNTRSTTHHDTHAVNTTVINITDHLFNTQ